jgi:cullin 1
VQWRANFFLHIQGKLAAAILRLIEHQRNGEAIDQGLVKKVVDSFVSLGIDESDLNRASLDNYREHFELPFLNATETYYRHESESFLAQNTVSDCLKKVEECLKEEEDRVARYLHTTTRKLLINKCEHVLLSGTLERKSKFLEEDAKRTGLAAVAELVGTDSAAIDSLEPKAYVDALLKVHSNFSDFVNGSFKGEAGLVASLDRACREFVNRNVATGTSSSRSPELLAKHADALLRKNNKLAEGDLEGELNRVARDTPIFVTAKRFLKRVL